MADEDMRNRQSDDEGGAPRIAASALMALGAIILLVAAAATALFLIAEVLHGQWALAGLALVVLAALYLLAKRVVRIAANQNKNPLG